MSEIPPSNKKQPEKGRSRLSKRAWGRITEGSVVLAALSVLWALHEWKAYMKAEAHWEEMLAHSEALKVECDSLESARIDEARAFLIGESERIGEVFEMWKDQRVEDSYRPDFNFYVVGVLNDTRARIYCPPDELMGESGEPGFAVAGVTVDNKVDGERFIALAQSTVRGDFCSLAEAMAHELVHVHLGKDKKRKSREGHGHDNFRNDSAYVLGAIAKQACLLSKPIDR